MRCKSTCQPVLLATNVSQESRVKQLRWNHADLLSYHNTTMCLLYPLYYELLELENVVMLFLHFRDVDRKTFINSYYSKPVDCLSHSADLRVPIHYKKNYKFWWSQQLSLSLIHI